MANKFSKALKHIKKDLKEVAPTNSMSGVYAINPPGFELGPPSRTKRFLPDVDGNFPAGIPGNPGDPYYERPAGHYVGDKDWDSITKPDFRNVRLGADGNNTEGLFEGNTVLANLPPNSRSYILGPLVDGFVYNHGYDAYTRIGYIDKATRGFVMLGYIRGQWSQNHVYESTGVYDNSSNAYNFPIWDGTTVDSGSGFHSYGSLTLADAQWMRTEILAGRYFKNTLYRASGGIGQPQAPIPPDKPEGWPEGTPWPPPGWYYGGAGVGAGSGDAGSGDPGEGYGAGGDPDVGTGQGEPGKGDPGDNNLWGMTEKEWNKLSKEEQEYIKSLPPGVREDLLKGGKTKDLGSHLIDLGMAAAAAAALKAAWGIFSKPVSNALQNEWSKRTLSDAAYAKFLQTGKMPPGIQGWNPFKAFTPKMLATGPTSGASAAIGAAISGLIGGSTPQTGGGGPQSTPGNPNQFSTGPQPNVQTEGGMKTNALVPPTKNAFKEFGNQLSNSIENTFKNVGEYLFQEPPDRSGGPRGQGNKLISSNPNRNQGVNSPGRYNLSLAVELPISIITGQPRQIPISPKAAIDMGNNINADALVSVLTLNQTTPMDASNTINPKGKSDQVFAGTGWGVQGGSTFNFNTETNKLEIVSNKTLRTTSGGESVERNKSGHPTRFSDIPDANPATVKSYTEKLLNNKAVDSFLGGLANSVKVVSLNNGRQGYQYDKFDGKGPKTYNNAWDMMKDNKDLGYDGMVKQLSTVATGIAETTVQGTASNSIALRKALQNLEVKSSTDSKGWKPFAGNSDVENIGGAYGQVSSKAEINLNDLPPKVQAVIRAKLGGNQSSISGKKDTQIAQANKPMPDYVKDSIKRQYKGGKDYKLEDMKNVINWHQKAHYEPQGKVLSESTRRQLREIKKPVEVREEAPKKLKGYRPNFKGRNRPQNTPDITASKKSDELVKATNTLGQAWRTSDKEFKTFDSQSTLNLVRDAHGHGDLAWQQILHDSAQKNGWRNREIQEQLNKVAHLKGLKEQGFDIQETEQWEREDNFDKVVKFKSIVGNLKTWQGDIKPEYPDEKPPELGQDGFHPQLGKKKDYYKRLDSVSARVMPKTGDPEIDATVDKQKKKKMVQPKVAEDTRSNWRDSLTDA